MQDWSAIAATPLACAVALAKSIWKEGRTLLATSALLAERGYVTTKGKLFSASQVKRLVEVE